MTVAEALHAEACNERDELKKENAVLRHALTTFIETHKLRKTMLQEVLDYKILPTPAAEPQQFTLCEDTAMLAVNGACPAHGGDACLREFVPLRP